ncbi:MAG: response regulator [Desulfobacula sp.]|jgi:PAS domain S-box-containing protein
MTTKILLADDEEGLRKVLSIYLQDAGYEVITADNGKKAALLADTTSPDIVLTDIRMPGMDGITLLKHIKETCPDIEVIMITGHGDYKLAIESLKLNAVDFISKPIDNDVLDIALRRANDRIENRKQIKAYTQNLEALVEEKTRKLTESEKRYIQLFNEAPCYITVQDRNLNIIETNRIFREHFNYTKTDSCYKIYKGREDACPDCPVLKTLTDGKSHTAEFEVSLKDGSTKHIYVQTSAITDDSGAITHVMEMSTDVTMIRELQDHLAALGLHIGAVSHGLKQVLTGLDGGSYLIDSGIEKSDTERIKEGWGIVKEKMSKTRRMVLDILYHTKKREPDRATILLNDLVGEIVSIIKPKAEKENVQLEIDCPENAISLHIDKTAIFSAFMSILENAVEACISKKKKGLVRFAIQIQSPHIIFSIKDNGKGIEESKKDKLFDLFYSDKGNKGTGLGLFIASRSIKQHGGTITVKSKVNQYTEFIIALPLS